MKQKKTILAILWIIIIAVVVAAIVCLIVLPKWKGIFLAGAGVFLILNLFISMYFIKRNFRN